jgi:hypothetical protein
MGFKAALEPTLNNAMMIVKEREKVMLLMGTGFPMTATWLNFSEEKMMNDVDIVSCGTRIRAARLALN